VSSGFHGHISVSEFALSVSHLAARVVLLSAGSLLVGIYCVCVLRFRRLRCLSVIHCHCCFTVQGFLAAPGFRRFVIVQAFTSSFEVLIPLLFYFIFRRSSVGDLVYFTLRVRRLRRPSGVCYLCCLIATVSRFY